MRELPYLDLIKWVEELLFDVSGLVLNHLYTAAHTVGHSLHVGGDIGHRTTDQCRQQKGVEDPPPILTQNLRYQDADDAPTGCREAHSYQQYHRDWSSNVDGQEESNAVDIPQNAQESTPGDESPHGSIQSTQVRIFVEPEAVPVFYDVRLLCGGGLLRG